MTLDFSILGLNHKSAPLAIRERFTVADKDRLDVLRKLAELAGEIVLLCTCNRTELIYAQPLTAPDERGEGFFRVFGNDALPDLERYGYHYHRQTALAHLFKVAGGLDSMVPGETQILGQVKDAFEFSIQHGFTQAHLFTVYQQTMHAAKAIRNETDVGRGAVSVGSVAVQLARNIFDDLNDKRVLLIGAGEMGELAAEHFHHHGITQLWVANRHLERARAIVAKYPGVAVELERFSDILPEVDIVLCSAANQKGMVTVPTIRQAMQARQGRPLFLIDLAVPRNVDPAINQISAVYLYNIDDLQQLIAANLQERQAEITKGERIAQMKVEEFSRNNGADVGPLIVSLRERVDGIKDKELDKLYNRLPQLSSAERESIAQTITQINNKILHDPIISLRRGALKDSGDHACHHDMISIFKNLFNL